MDSWQAVRSHFDTGFVSRETQLRLERYVALIRKWQPSINLVSNTTLDSVWTRHIADCLQLSRLVGGPRIWLDMGSGAGLPGLVTAITLLEWNEGWVHLVESNHKKAAFLRQAIIETGARASVHAVRVDEIVDQLPDIAAISARALAPLDDLLTTCAPLMRLDPAPVCWFHKGLDYRNEVRSARDRWSFDLVEHGSNIQDGSAILEIRHIRPRSQDTGHPS